VNHRFVAYAVGKLLMVLAMVLCIPAAIAAAEVFRSGILDGLTDARLSGFLAAIIGSLLAGWALVRWGENTPEGASAREGFAIVTFSWLVLTLFGCIPYFIYLLAHSPGRGVHTVALCFTNAYFEIMSGFTTTGATITTDIEILPKGILFWRSMTHWLGGMGIVTLALAIFPAFGVAGYQMFRGEIPGPTKERLKPRLAQTATILWGVYALLTFAETFFLFLGGMSLLEAFCHAFGTMATGGFSTRNASIAAYKSAYIDWVVIVFMLCAGTNFMIHYRMLFARKFDAPVKDPEFRFYIGVVVVAILIGVMDLQIEGLGPREHVARSFRHTTLSEEQVDARMAVEADKISSVAGSIRHAAFQVVSLTTTTGFCTADFDMWPNALRLILVALMFFGGCAGSTGGGIKMVRILVVFKAAWRQIRTTIQPRLVAPMKVGGGVVEEKLVQNIVGFFVFFIVLFALFSAIMSFIVPDFTTAVTAVVATMCNIGPGLSGIGATENYAWIPIPGKWILVCCMLLGRLEVFTVIVAFAPISWRR